MMKTMTTTALVFVVAAMLTGVSAPAFAQDGGAQRPRHEQGIREPGPHMKFRVGDRRDHRREMRRERGVLAFVCSPRGADRLEHMLLTIEQRTNPTPQQTDLFEAFRTAALTAQTDFADACTGARPATREERQDRNIVDRLAERLAVDKARVVALNLVLPHFQAFYNSLSADQKIAFEPRAMRRMHREHLPESATKPATPAPSHT